MNMIFLGILWISLGLIHYTSAFIIILFFFYLLISKKMPYFAIIVGFITILIAIYALFIYGNFYYSILYSYLSSHDFFAIESNFFDTPINAINRITFIFLNVPTILLILVILTNDIFSEKKTFRKNTLLRRTAIIMGIISLTGFVFGALLNTIFPR